MGEFIYFTEEQKERANAVHIADILQKEHEEIERSGNEWRWKRHNSVTFRGNGWYRHSPQAGSHAIDFMQEFFGMTYPQAVTYLLNGETGQVIRSSSRKIPVRAAVGNKKQQDIAEKVKQSEIRGRYPNPTSLSITDVKTMQEAKNQPPKTDLKTAWEESDGIVQSGNMDINTSHQKMPQETGTTEKKKFPVPPQKNDSMKRVYAYLIQKRHIHKKGTCSDGKSFRMNEDGSDSSYGFGYAGKGNRLYVFEAPIDLLSF